MSDTPWKSVQKAIGPFESDEAVISWLGENPDLEEHVIAIQHMESGDKFVMLKQDGAEGES